MPFKDSPEGETQTGGIEALICKCGQRNVLRFDMVQRIMAVDYHLRNCKEKDCKHGKALEFGCNNCGSYLGQILAVNPEFINQGGKA